ncbi:MAG: hypothetical protein M4579_003433 [Chaenotheca gracillima]|nr:MAG: hypothetical protein M4579_003433 [Chaenotheca gracillima]
MDRDLFEKQSIVDTYVDDIASTFGVKRRSLNVVATAKGLVAGQLIIIRKDASQLNCMGEEEGTLMPDVMMIERLEMPGLSWILIVEKEGTTGYLSSACIYCILASTATREWFNRHGEINESFLQINAPLTDVLKGKGYPDISTRAFLHLVSICATDLNSKSPRLFALTDLDPDGIAIHSTYKYGSAALAHENEQLTVRNLRSIGLSNSDVYSIDAASEGRGVLSLTVRDRRQARKMLERDIYSENGPEPGWRRELQIMLFTNVKAEIQVINEGNQTFDQWLEGKLVTALSQL